MVARVPSGPDLVGEMITVKSLRSTGGPRTFFDSPATMKEMARVRFVPRLVGELLGLLV